MTLLKTEQKYLLFINQGHSSLTTFNIFKTNIFVNIQIVKPIQPLAFSPRLDPLLSTATIWLLGSFVQILVLVFKQQTPLYLLCMLSTLSLLQSPFSTMVYCCKPLPTILRHGSTHNRTPKAHACAFTLVTAFGNVSFLQQNIVLVQEHHRKHVYLYNHHHPSIISFQRCILHQQLRRLQKGNDDATWKAYRIAMTIYNILEVHDVITLGTCLYHACILYQHFTMFWQLSAQKQQSFCICNFYFCPSIFSLFLSQFFAIFKFL